jgi:hypothetical protein
MWASGKYKFEFPIHIDGHLHMVNKLISFASSPVWFLVVDQGLFSEDLFAVC